MRKFSIISMALVLLLTLTNCQTHNTFPQAQQMTNELLDTTMYLKGRAENRVVFHQETCVEFTKTVRDQLYERSPDFYLPKNEAESQFMISNSKSILLTLFQLRLEIVARYRQFSSPTYPCLESLKKSLLAIRSVEDQLLLWLHSKNAIPHAESRFADLQYPSTIWPEKLNTYFAAPGDIILFSSQNPLLQNMTRIFASDETYDHLGLLVLNPKGQKLILEMHPETGLSFHSLDYLDLPRQKRLAIYRMKKTRVAEIASQAGFMHFDRLKNTQHLTYDRLYQNKETQNDEQKLINSKIVQKSYEFAVQGMYQVPSRQTMYIDLQKSKVLDQLGITARRIFLPLDIELDVKFEQVAEYRKISELDQTLTQEAATASLFHWMAEQKYEFNSVLKNPETHLHKFKLIREMVTNAMFDAIKIKNVSAPMTYKQRLELAEAYRARDCLKMIQHQAALKYDSHLTAEPPIFHYSFGSVACSPKAMVVDSVL